MFQEAAQVASEGMSDTTKAVIAAAMLVLSNLLTYWTTRRTIKSTIELNAANVKKVDADIRKSDADVHKSEADTAKTQVETIRMLSDELDEAIAAQIRARENVENLLRTRDAVADIIEAAARSLSRVIEDAVQSVIPQTLRMRLVSILEALYTAKDKLRG